VTTLAQVPDDVKPVVLGKSLMSALQVASALRDAKWEVLDRLRTLTQPEAEPIRETLRSDAAANELAAPLAKALAQARSRTLRLIMKRGRHPDQGGPTAPVTGWCGAAGPGARQAEPR
jgi:hypothetical protein